LEYRCLFVLDTSIADMSAAMGKRGKW